MDQKLVKSGFYRHTYILCLAGCCVNGNDYISQKVGADVAKLALLHRKSNHIGRSGPIQVGFVQFSYFWIVYNQDGQFPIKSPQGL